VERLVEDQTDASGDAARTAADETTRRGGRGEIDVRNVASADLTR
jgi:hypothetical protein